MYNAPLPQAIPFTVSVTSLKVDDIDLGELFDDEAPLTIRFRAEREASVAPEGAGIILRAEGALRGVVVVTRAEIRAALLDGETTDNRKQAFAAVQRAAVAKVLATLPALKTAMENA